MGQCWVTMLNKYLVDAVYCQVSIVQGAMFMVLLISLKVSSQCSDLSLIVSVSASQWRVESGYRISLSSAQNKIYLGSNQFLQSCLLLINLESD